MTILQTGFWDVVAGLGQGGAGAVIGAVVVFYFMTKEPKNGNGSKRSACVLANADSDKLRSMEISNHVIVALGPKIEDQTELLRDIRDGVRDLKG